MKQLVTFVLVLDEHSDDTEERKTVYYLSSFYHSLSHVQVVLTKRVVLDEAWLYSTIRKL